MAKLLSCAAAGQLCEAMAVLAVADRPISCAQRPGPLSRPPKQNRCSIPYLGVPSPLYSVHVSAEFTLLRTWECRVHSTPYLGVNMKL